MPENFKIPRPDKITIPPLPKEVIDDIPDFTDDASLVENDNVIQFPVRENVAQKEVEDFTHEAMLEEDEAEPLTEIPALITHEAQATSQKIDQIRNQIVDLFPDIHSDFEKENSDSFRKLKGRNSITETRPSTKSVEDFSMGGGNDTFQRDTGAATNFNELAKQYNIDIQSDGSVPRGGILGGNKRKFEKLLVNREDFRKQYDTMLADQQIAASARGDFKKQTKNRFGQVIALSAALGGAMGGSVIKSEADHYGNNRRAETASQMLGSNTPTDVSTTDAAYQQIPEIENISAKGKEIRSKLPHLGQGDRVQNEYLQELQTMKPQETKTLNIRGIIVEMHINKKGERVIRIGENSDGIATFSAKIDNNGIAHPTTNKVPDIEAWALRIMKENADL